MAYSVNRGLTYFPMDVSTITDPEIRGLTRRCGSDGLYIYLTILSAAYGQEGYFVRWTENMCGDTADNVRCSVDQVEETVQECLRLGLFDVNAFGEHCILTSIDIQLRYAYAVKERVRMRKVRGTAPLSVKREYWLAGDEVLEQMGIFYDDQKPLVTNVHEPFANKDDKVKESKVKESKENKSKGEESKVRVSDVFANAAPEPSEPADTSDAPKDDGTPPVVVGCVTLAGTDYDALCAEFGKPVTDAKIAHLDSWKRQTGKPALHPYSLLRDWLSKDALVQSALNPAPPPCQSAYKAQNSPPNPPYNGKRTGAHYAGQRQYTDEELNSLLDTDIDLLNA